MCYKKSIYYGIGSCIPRIALKPIIAAKEYQCALDKNKMIIGNHYMTNNADIKYFQSYHIGFIYKINKSYWHPFWGLFHILFTFFITEINRGYHSYTIDFINKNSLIYYDKTRVKQVVIPIFSIYFKNKYSGEVVSNRIKITNKPISNI